MPDGTETALQAAEANRFLRDAQAVLDGARRLILELEPLVASGRATRAQALDGLLRDIAHEVRRRQP